MSCASKQRPSGHSIEFGGCLAPGKRLQVYAGSPSLGIGGVGASPTLSLQAMQARQHLQGLELYEGSLSISSSKNHQVTASPTIDDESLMASPSTHRRTIYTGKNVVPPSNTLHISNIHPDMMEVPALPAWRQPSPVLFAASARVWLASCFCFCCLFLHYSPYKCALSEVLLYACGMQQHCLSNLRVLFFSWGLRLNALKLKQISFISFALSFALLMLFCRRLSFSHRKAHWFVNLRISSRLVDLKAG